MKHIIRNLSVVAAIFGLLICSANAQINIEPDFSNDVVVISGNLKADKEVFLQVVPYGTEKTTMFDAIAGGATVGDYVKFNDQVKTDENGYFSVSATLDSGDYCVFYSLDGQLKTSEKFTFTTSTEYGILIADLNLKVGDETEFKTFVNSNFAELGFDSSIVTPENKASSISYFYDYMQGKQLDSTKSEDNTKTFNTCVAAASISEISDFDVYVDKIMISESDIYDLYSEYVNTDEKETYFVSKMKQIAPSSFDSFQTAFKDAVLLTVMKYPEGYQNLKYVAETYGTYMNITTVGVTDNVWKQMPGEYNSISDFAQALTRTISEQKPASRPQTGGSSSSGGGSFGVAPPAKPIVKPDESIEESKDEGTVKMNFTDLNSVPWAYTAISTLSDKGIISGVTETEFYPDDTITREAFVKMSVCAAGEDIEKYAGENVFGDVKESDWFAKYVNIGNEIGLCYGIDADNFGVGMEISRQDMAVILYRLMISKGISFKSSELEFKDRGEIAGYAKEAVSALFSKGIISGTGDNRFNPKGMATRAEAAQMIYGVLRYL